MAAWSEREPFGRGLRDLGWTPGSNILIEQRYAEGKSERLLGLATDLVQMKVGVIVAHGPAVIRAARQATRPAGPGSQDPWPRGGTEGAAVTPRLYDRRMPAQ